MGNNNARIIEKDVFADIGKAYGGDGDIIDLNGASKFSCQAVYDVQAPSALTFASGVAALLVVQDLTYTADVRGTAGNSITIAYTAGGTAGAEVVTVVGTAISVQIETAVSTATQIKTAVDASVAASALISVAVSGTGSNAQVVAAVTPLAGGVASGVDVTANTLTMSGDTFPLGFKVRLTTTGTLPAGLALATDYFVIRTAVVNVIKLASSLNNAIAGTPVDITGQGSSGATNTATGVALSGASVTFQKSNDQTNWVNIQAATSITVDGSVLLSQPDVSYRYFKAVKAITAGIVDLKGLVLVIGDPI